MKTAGNTGVTLQGVGQYFLCVKCFCGGTTHEIHQCMTSRNKHAIKLTMCILIKGLPILVWGKVLIPS